MNFLVLYSTIEGQTRKIAEAIASHLECPSPLFRSRSPLRAPMRRKRPRRGIIRSSCPMKPGGSLDPCSNIAVWLFQALDAQGNSCGRGGPVDTKQDYALTNWTR
jgi:hypothetical protein